MAIRGVTRLHDEETGLITANGLGYGGEIGYEYQLLPRWLLGIGVNYLYAGKAETTIQSDNRNVKITFDSTSFINSLISIKFLF